MDPASIRCDTLTKPAPLAVVSLDIKWDLWEFANSNSNTPKLFENASISFDVFFVSTICRAHEDPWNATSGACVRRALFDRHLDLS